MHKPKNEEESAKGLIMFLNTKCIGFVEMRLSTFIISSPMVL